MSTLTLFNKGLARTVRQGRMALRLWAVNFAFTLLIAAPLAVFVHGHVSRSLSAGDLLARVDVHWLADFSRRAMDAAPLALGLLAVGAAFYLLLAVFLNGGLIGGLLRPGGRSTPAEFFHDCGLYFWRFLRLALLSLPAYLLVAGALHGLLAAALRALTRQAASEWPLLAANVLRLLALVLLLGVVSMFFDYAKIGLAANGRRGVLREAWRTLGFLGRRFFRAWGLYLLAGLAFVALTLLYLEVARILPKGTPWLALAVFLWQQLFILGRQFSRILFFATEIELAEQAQGHA